MHPTFTFDRFRQRLAEDGPLTTLRRGATRAISTAWADVLARAAYRVVLRRPVDPGALKTWRDEIGRDPERLVSLVHSLFVSTEYEGLLAHSGRSGELMLNHLHLERCRLVAGLPPARRIVDLGGAVPGDPRGGLLVMGYPHAFETLTIVDMPPGGTLEQRNAVRHADHQTPQGTVRYAYCSMADLANLALPSDSVDLLWMGQSFEHITEAQADALLPEILRVLRPGGHFCLDTPNGRVARLQRPTEMLHPDHKLEYEVAHLTSKIRNAGFSIERVQGIGLAERSCRTGAFDAMEVVRTPSLNDRPEESTSRWSSPGSLTGDAAPARTGDRRVSRRTRRVRQWRSCRVHGGHGAGQRHATRRQPDAVPRLGSRDLMRWNATHPSRASVRTSSQLQSPSSVFAPANLLDGRLETAWCEGVEGDGVGEWFELRVEKPGCRLEGLAIVPGYAKSPALYLANGRLRKVRVSVCGRSESRDVDLTVDDDLALAGQLIVVDDPTHLGESPCIRLQFADVVPGRKYEDTCVSELAPVLNCG